MRKICNYIYLSLFVALMLVVGSCGGGVSALHSAKVDSLSHALSARRYSGLAALDAVADTLSAVAVGDNEALMIAANASAYVDMMRMDYV